MHGSKTTFRTSGFKPEPLEACRRSESVAQFLRWLCWAVCGVGWVLTAYAWGSLVDQQAQLDDAQRAWHQGYTSGVQACPPETERKP